MAHPYPKNRGIGVRLQCAVCLDRQTELGLRGPKGRWVPTCADCWSKYRTFKYNGTPRLGKSRSDVVLLYPIPLQELFYEE